MGRSQSQTQIELSSKLAGQNPPSIPSHNNVFGYEYKEGQFIKQSNPEQHYTGEKQDKIGPGHYNAARALVQPNN